MVHLKICPVKLKAANDAAFRFFAVPKYTALLSAEDPLVVFSFEKSIQKVMDDLPASLSLVERIRRLLHQQQIVHKESLIRTGSLRSSLL
jgi:isocitrate dehydrogenase kinase/phosphatase